MTGPKSARATSSPHNCSSRNYNHADVRDFQIRLVGDPCLGHVRSPLGNVVLSGNGPLHVCDHSCAGRHESHRLELPYFSFVQQIRPGGSAVLDEMLGWQRGQRMELSIKNSPGRASAMCSVECVTTGMYTSPSGITLAAAVTPHEFNAGMITALTFNRRQLPQRRRRQAVRFHGRLLGEQLPAGFFPWLRLAGWLSDPGALSSGATGPSPCSLWFASRPLDRNMRA